MTRLLRRPDRCRDILIGLLLAVSAITKALARPTLPGPQMDIALLFIGIEFSFAVWLFVGMYASVTRILSLNLFACFLGVALYRHLEGARDCGCFGELRMPPASTAAMDCLVLLTLLTVRCSDRHSPSPERWWTFGFVTLASNLLLLLIPFAFQPDKEFEEIQLVGLANSRFPYLDDVDIGPSLATGSWVVLLVHPGCEACKQEVSRREEEARRLNLRLAIIQMPSRDRVDLPPHNGRVIGLLRDRKRWVAHTPLTFRLDDGIVSHYP